MRKLKILLMISLGLLYSCSPVAANTNYRSEKPVICGTVDEIIELVKEQGEEPFLKGEGISMQENGTYLNSSYIIGFNQKTGSWTLIELLSHGHACILGNGNKLQIFTQQKGINLKLALDILIKICYK